MMKFTRINGRVSVALAGTLALIAALPLDAGVLSYDLRLESVERDRVNVPVAVAVPVDDRDGAWSAELRGADDQLRVVQIEPAKAPADPALRIYWVEPFIAGGEAPEFTLSLDRPGSPGNEEPGFRFDYREGYQELLFNDRPVLRYVTVYDPDRHADTHKPYHHVHGFHGEGFITKGPGGRFPHHKGIYLGWNHTRTEAGEQFDFWHAPKEYQRHGEFLRDDEAAGPVMARSASTTYWRTGDEEPVVRDTREVTTWNLADGVLLLDYAIAIESLEGEIYLGGDAHHAGFQFRAAQEVVENAAETTFVFPEGAEPEGNDNWGGASWAAMSFDIQGNPYTVLHMDHSGNPRPTVYSTRNYGRFGAFFASPVSEEAPLKLNYRIVIKDSREGKGVSREAFEGFYADYLHPASVEVRKR